MKGLRRHPSWKWIRAEVARDLAAGVGNPALWCMVILVVMLLCGGVDALTVRQMTERAWTYREAGGDLLMVSAPNGVDVRACENLAELPNVQGSTAMRSTDLVAPMALPSSPYTAYETTPGAKQVFGINGDEGFAISGTISSQLGIHAGNAMTLKNGEQAKVTGTFDWPNDGRLPQYATTVLLAIPKTEVQGAFDSCWVRAWPRTDVISDALLATVMQSSSQSGSTVLGVTTINPTLGSTPPNETDYRQRITRFATIPAFILAIAIGATYVARRRLELAMLRHLGASGPQVVVQMTVETAVWALPAAMICAGIFAVLLAPIAESVRDALTVWADVGLRMILVTYCGTMLGAMAMSATIRVDALPRLVRGR